MPKVLPRPGSLAAGGAMTLGPDGTGKGCLLLAQRGLEGLKERVLLVLNLREEEG